MGRNHTEVGANQEQTPESCRGTAEALASLYFLLWHTCSHVTPKTSQKFHPDVYFCCRSKRRHTLCLLVQQLQLALCIISCPASRLLCYGRHLQPGGVGSREVGVGVGVGV